MRFGGPTTFVCATVFAGCTHANTTTVAPPRPAPPAPPVVTAPPAPADLVDEYWPVMMIKKNPGTETATCKRVRVDFEEAWNQAVICRSDADCEMSIGTCTSARPDAKALLERRLAALRECVDMIGISSCKHPSPICFGGRCRVRGCQEKENSTCS